MKQSILYLTIKCIVGHEDDQDPEDVIAEADCQIVIEPNSASQKEYHGKIRR
jgi:hypothetical protein